MIARFMEHSFRAEPPAIIAVRVRVVLANAPVEMAPDGWARDAPEVGTVRGNPTKFGFSNVAGQPEGRSGRAASQRA
jgi:hypothetical protein